MSVKTKVQNVNSTEIYIGKFEKRNTTNVIDGYIQKIKVKDVEQIKIYLGVLYFFALTFLSVSLLI